VQEDESILLTGTLKDKFHDISIDVVVDSLSLEIVRSSCLFKAAPSQYCKQLEERLDSLQGIVVGKGLSRAINGALGGVNGCGNLRTLLLGLLPLALNVKASKGISDDQDVLDVIHHKLQGTCIGYPTFEPDQ
ncbi:MAG: DUF2889 domain-containing protein, partial [Desulfuromonadales bacterium]|nr:DUF2889 domain-containing protein [Desulfuromonadales bacterium]